MTYTRYGCFLLLLLFLNALVFSQERNGGIDQAIEKLRENQAKLMNVTESVSGYFNLEKNTLEELKKLLGNFKQKKDLHAKIDLLEQITLYIYRLSESLDNCEFQLVNSSDIYHSADDIFDKLIEVCTTFNNHWKSEEKAATEEYVDAEKSLSELGKQIQQLSKDHPNFKNVKTVEDIMKLSDEQSVFEKFEKWESLHSEFRSKMRDHKLAKDRKEVCPILAKSYERAIADCKKARFNWGRSANHKPELQSYIDGEEKRLVYLIEYTREQLRIGKLENLSGEITKGLSSLGEIHTQISSLQTILINYAEIPFISSETGTTPVTTVVSDEEAKEYYKKYVGEEL